MTELPRPTPPELPRPTPAERPLPDLERLRTVINSASDRQLIELLRMVEAETPAVADQAALDLQADLYEAFFRIERVASLFAVLEPEVSGWPVDHDQRAALLLGMETLAEKTDELGRLLLRADVARMQASKDHAPVPA